MTHRLILTRHTKSAWDAPTPSDHARPLNKRGRKSAFAIGNWLRERGYLPDQVISSPSQRTRETHELMKLDAPGIFAERLYLGPSGIMFDVLTEAEHPVILMIGHNPGIAAFAHSLAKRPPGHPRFDDYPTGATLVLDFDISSWSELTWGSGEPVDFVVPRDLLE
ncbi:MAG: SixA phosphatase family protein [Paracoccaceae bacterium]